MKKLKAQPSPGFGALAQMRALFAVLVLRGRRSTFAMRGADFVRGATLSQGHVQISWQAQHFREVNHTIPWHAQHFRKLDREKCVSCFLER